MTLPQLSVVIVNWNAGVALKRCLSSIPAAAGSIPYEVILVDNASTDDSVSYAEDQSELRLLSQERNLGFGRGVDVGVRVSRGKYIAVVNPDVILRADALRELVGFLQEHPESGLVGPRVCSPDGTIETGAERFPGLLSALADVPWLARSYRRARSRRRKAENAVMCDWVRGALMVLRAGALRESGGFPTTTFMYGEEMLLGSILRQAGWRVHYLPKTLATHDAGFSSRQRWTREESILVRRVARIRVMRHLLSAPAFALWNFITITGLTLQRVAHKFAGGKRERHYMPYGRLLRVHGQALIRLRAPTHFPEGRIS